jgi:iron complex outermembrane recepter protein
MMSLSRLLKVSTSMLCLSLPAMAHAQDRAVVQADAESSADAGANFGDIVVTAQRRSERLQDTPLAITALSGTALQRAPITDISDIQTSVPNVNISLHNSAAVVAIRGIGFDILTAGADGSVAIHTDGVYQSRPSSALGALYDVDRIEVARGPQGTLYGRNATGGAINVVSRKPTSTPEGYVNLTYANYNSVSVEAALSGPISGDVLRARISAKIEQRDGWGKNLFNGKDIDDVKSRAIRAMIDFRPSDTVSFLLSGEYFKRDDSGAANHVAGCVTPVCGPNAATSRGFTLPSDPRDVDQDFQPVYRPEQYAVSLTSRVELPFADLTAISGYRDGNFYWLTDFDGTRQREAFLTREENYKTFSQEVQLGHRDGNVDWILGGFYFYEKNYARANGHFVPFFAPTFTDYFQGGTLYTNAYAVFGELSYHLTPELTLTAGGRYSHEKKRIKGEFTFTRGPVNIVARQAAPTAAIPCVTCRGLPDSVSFNAFTPKIGVQYKFSSNQMLYVTVQKGFKSGGFAAGAVTPSFQPETIWNYEAGLKATWLDRALTTNIAVYHYDYKDLQVGQVIGNATQIANAGTAKVDGIETEFRLALGEHLSLDGFGSYNHARITNYTVPNAAINPALPLDLSGNLLSNAPKWTGKIGLEYKADAFGGSLTWRGELFSSSRVYFSTFNNATNDQDPYTLFNASLRYEGADDWFANLFMNNITNRTVKAGGVVSSGTVGSIVGVTYLPPRTYGVTVGKRF